jgi:hypothetical protein
MEQHKIKNPGIYSPKLGSVTGRTRELGVIQAGHAGLFTITPDSFAPGAWVGLDGSIITICSPDGRAYTHTVCRGINFHTGQITTSSQEVRHISGYRVYPYTPTFG